MVFCKVRIALHRTDRVWRRFTEMNLAQRAYWSLEVAWYLGGM
jgi:hypothetical protein